MINTIFQSSMLPCEELRFRDVYIKPPLSSYFPLTFLSYTTPSLALTMPWCLAMESKKNPYPPYGAHSVSLTALSSLAMRIGFPRFYGCEIEEDDLVYVWNESGS